MMQWRILIIWVLLPKITTHRILFLQETHSISDNEQKFFAHKKRNSCSVLTFCFVTHKFVVNNQKTDNEGRILILNVTINDVNFVLINLYNANTETKQVSVLNNLSSLLENFDLILEKKFNFGRRFSFF